LHFQGFGGFFFLLVYFCWSTLIACSWCKKNGHGHQGFFVWGNHFWLLYVSGSTVVGLQRSGLSDGNVSRYKTLTYFVEKPAEKKKKKKKANKVHLFFYVYGR